MSFAAESGAESGIVDLRCAVHEDPGVSPVRQGCGSMTEEAVPPAARNGSIYWFTQQQKRSAVYPKFRQIRFEKRGGQLFDVQ
jgi:hypothetical protein